MVAAIKEETFPEIEQHGAAAVHWLSLGELSKLIETFKAEGVTRAIMAGQVKHKQIFSSIKPDWKLAKLLLSLTTRNTDSLIGAISKVLAEEGITLVSSTELLEPMLAGEGVLTRRAPSDSEQTNITYGRAVAHHLARFDIGQTVVIAEAACVAVEAMEGTDAAILRAGEIVNAAVAGQGAFDPEPRADGGEGGQAESGHALRRAGGRPAHDRDDEAGGRDLPGAGCRTLPAAGQGSRAGRRQRRRHLHRGRRRGQPHPPSQPVTCRCMHDQKPSHAHGPELRVLLSQTAPEHEAEFL